MEKYYFATFQKKTTEQYFPEVLFIVLGWVVYIWVCAHENYRAKNKY